MRMEVLLVEAGHRVERPEAPVTAGVPVLVDVEIVDRQYLRAREVDHKKPPRKTRGVG